MIDILTLTIVAGVFGLVFGSFAGASVWRLRARQLVEDKKAGEPYDKKEYKQLVGLTKSKLSGDRSRCLECRHELRWYDLLPLVSWMSTGGKCRYCRTSIGWFEPIIELTTAMLFATVFMTLAYLNGAESWPVIILMLAITLGLVVLFFYDLRWLLLPDVIMWPVIFLSAIYAGIQAYESGDGLAYLISTGYSVLILSGLYLGLWLASRGKWVGFGDVKLGLALGLLLGSWQLAFLALFLANLIGTLIVLPGLLRKTLSRRSQVPFGPLLIVGFFIAFLAGQPIIDWYIGLTTGFVGTLLML